MEELLLTLVTQYPVMASIVVVMGSLRLCLKPVFVFLNAFVKATPYPKDDEL